MSTNQQEIGNVICSMKKSPGHDDISISVRKMCKQETTPFFYIINKLLLQGCFPNHLHIPRLVLIYIKSDQSCLFNYWLTYILPCFNSIYEQNSSMQNDQLPITELPTNWQPIRIQTKYFLITVQIVSVDSYLWFQKGFWYHQPFHTYSCISQRH